MKNVCRMKFWDPDNPAKKTDSVHRKIPHYKHLDYSVSTPLLQPANLLGLHFRSVQLTLLHQGKVKSSYRSK